ncbi:MAG: VanW family protein [Clostridiales bacterium]
MWYNLKNFVKERKKGIAIVLLLAIAAGLVSYYVSDLLIDKENKNLFSSDAKKKEELKKEIEGKLKESNNYEIVLNTKDKEKTITFSDISVQYDLEKAVENMQSNKDIDFYSYDDKKLDKIINTFQEDACKKSSDFKVEDKEKSVIIEKGVQGEELDKKKAKEDIEDNIKLIQSGKIDIKIDKVKPVYSEDTLYKSIYKKPENATVKTNGKSYEIVPHIMGRDVDKNVLKDVLKKFETNEEKQEIDIKLVSPEITTEVLQNKIFKDNLASYVTDFSSSTPGRATNVTLATQSINGTILAPGATFSYNNIVGPRTKARGYQEAPEYSGGEVVMGVGGGVCQVSTTLHNAVLRIPTMKIIARSCHMFTVSYVEPGFDASVSYGSLDYQFRNDSKWPVKINTSAGGRKLSISVSGTKEGNKLVSLSSQKISDIPFKTVYENDPTLSKGVERAKNTPHNGMVVKMYRVVNENGVQIANDVFTSNYRALDAIILKGTKGNTNPKTTPKATLKSTTKAVVTPVPTEVAAEE